MRARRSARDARQRHPPMADEIIYSALACDARTMRWKQKKKKKKNWLLLSLLVNYERANKWWEKTKTSMQGSDDGIDFPRGKERQTERWRKLMMASRCFGGKRLLWHTLTLKCSTAYRWQSWSTRKYNQREKNSTSLVVISLSVDRLHNRSSRSLDLNGTTHDTVQSSSSSSWHFSSSSIMTRNKSSSFRSRTFVYSYDIHISLRDFQASFV